MTDSWSISGMACLEEESRQGKGEVTLLLLPGILTTVRKEQLALEKLRENKPRYRLDHIIRERYPTFEDALQDIDDALNMICLFAILHQTGFHLTPVFIF